MSKESKVIVFVVLLNVLILFLGTAQYKGLSHFTTSWAFASVTIINFWGLYYIIKSHITASDSSVPMKEIITGTFIITYIMVIVVYIFTDIETAETVEAKAIIGNFTYLMGIVIVSYFGTDSFDKYFKSKTVTVVSKDIEKT